MFPFISGSLARATVAEISKGDIIQIELLEMCVTATVATTSLAQGTLSFVPFAYAKPPETTFRGFGVANAIRG